MEGLIIGAKITLGIIALLALSLYFAITVAFIYHTIKWDILKRLGYSDKQIRVSHMYLATPTEMVVVICTILVALVFVSNLFPGLFGLGP